MKTEDKETQAWVLFFILLDVISLMLAENEKRSHTS